MNDNEYSRDERRAHGRRALAVAFTLFLLARTGTAKDEERVSEQAPRISVFGSHASDDQPLERSSAGVALRGLVMPRLDGAVSVDALHAASTSALDAVSASGTAKLRVGAAALDLSAGAGVRSWSDERVVVAFSSGAVFLPLAAASSRIGVERTEEMLSFAAIAGHVLRDTPYLEISWRDLLGFTGAARVERAFYSDGNRIDTAFAWALFALVDSEVRLSLGYAGAYRDARASRYVAITGRFYPYFTPLDSVRHGPSAAAGVTLGPVRLDSSLSVALSGTERDPSYLDAGVRRKTRYLESRSSGALATSRLVSAVSYHYLAETYYRSHTLSLDVGVVL